MNAHKRKDQDTRLMELASRFRVVASYLDIKYYFHSYLSLHLLFMLSHQQIAKKFLMML